MRKILISGLFLCILSSCYTIPKKVLSQSYPEQPRRDEYHFSRKKFEFNPKIDTSVAYLARENWYVNRSSQLTTEYSFIRFSGDGVAFVSKSDERMPKDRDFNEMMNGQFCLYLVTEKKITVEIYDHVYRQFYYLDGELNDSGFVFSCDRQRHWWSAKEKISQQHFVKIAGKPTTPIKFPH